MIEQDLFDALAPRASTWAKEQEQFILARGSALTARLTEDAVSAGVQDPSRVRVLVVDRIPLPADEQLADASRRADIITDKSRAVAIGYGIIVRADQWGDRELMVHQLVHVAQCERSGGLDAFVAQYLFDRRTSPTFTTGDLEDEARRVAREVCAA